MNDERSFLRAFIEFESSNKFYFCRMVWIYKKMLSWVPFNITYFLAIVQKKSEVWWNKLSEMDAMEISMSKHMHFLTTITDLKMEIQKMILYNTQLCSAICSPKENAIEMTILFLFDILLDIFPSLFSLSRIDCCIMLANGIPLFFISCVCEDLKFNSLGNYFFL